VPFLGRSVTQKRSRLQYRLGIGTQAPNRFPGAIGALHAMLTDAGVRYVFYSYPDTSHEWLTWRRDLNDSAPDLFEDV
jgi:enterochelin esterase-like enzyme